MRATEKRHRVVSKEEWLEARVAFLKKEKEFTRQRDELSKAAGAAEGKSREKVRF